VYVLSRAREVWKLERERREEEGEEWETGGSWKPRRNGEIETFGWLAGPARRVGGSSGGSLWFLEFLVVAPGLLSSPRASTDLDRRKCEGMYGDSQLPLMDGEIDRHALCVPRICTNDATVLQYWVRSRKWSQGFKNKWTPLVAVFTDEIYVATVWKCQNQAVITRYLKVVQCNVFSINFRHYVIVEDVLEWHCLGFFQSCSMWSRRRWLRDIKGCLSIVSYILQSLAFLWNVLPQKLHVRAW
jgi:hypothetical protein